MNEKARSTIPEDEPLFPLNAVSDEFVNQPGGFRGKKPQYQAIHRWASKGCRGHVLETWLIGGRRYTSRDAIRRFLTALNSGNRNPAGGGFSNPHRRDQERVERELDALGL